MKDKKDPAVLKAALSLSFLLFSSAVTRDFPWSIKGKAGCPIRGIATHRSIQARPDRININPSNLKPTRSQDITSIQARSDQTITNPSNPEHTAE